MFAWLFGVQMFAQAQQTKPNTQPSEDDVKITVEEVVLSVTAVDSTGRRDPTLTIDDLLVLEDGVPQQIKGLHYLPANVVLLLDTGGELTWSKKVAVTREAARRIVSELSEGDRIAIVQASDHVEVLQSWTTNTNEAKKALETKLLSGKKTKLYQAVQASVELFKEPTLNRHLVLITDGIDSVSDSAQREDVYKKLQSANVTVHVLSYTSVEKVSASKTSQPIKTGEKRRETLDDVFVDEVFDSSVPESLKPILKSVRRAPRILTLDLDIERMRKIKAHQKALKESESRLVRLSDETGGGSYLPSNLVDFIESGDSIAQRINAQYIVTYSPKKPIVNSQDAKERRVQVVGRRVGLYVTAKRNIVPSIR